MEGLDSFLTAYGVIAIFGILLVKSIGVPIPIPSDAIMLVAAARVAEDRMILWQAFVAILAALVIGGTIQFILIRLMGRKLLYRYGRYLGLTPARLDVVSGKMQHSNPVGIGVAILTPGVRSVTIPACGLAGVSLSSFIAGLALGSALFFALHFFLGYAGRSLLATLGISLPVALGILAGLVIAGLIVWVVIRRQKRPDAPTGELVAEAFNAWHEATCPACLALGAISNLEHAHSHS